MKRVMVIDDEPDITSGIAGCLEDQYRVEVHNNPSEAISKFSKGKFDVVLIDIKMPRINGFELYKTLSRMDRDASYCFMTAFEIRLPEFQKLFPSSHVDLFLKKPFTAKDLISVIERQAIQKTP
jgi:CheY-like chemotaxis protein